MTKPWPRVGKIVTIASERGRSLRRETFQSPIQKEEFVTFNSNPDVTSVIVPITDDGNILAIRQFRAGANQVILELPGGNRKNSLEDLAKTAERELLEETGHAAGEIIPLLKDGVFFEPVICTQYFFPYLALNCKYVTEPEIDNDCLELVKMSLEEWLERITDGSIRDGKSLASTLLALQYIKRL